MFEYPDLYKAANVGSARAQKQFLNLIRIEYVALTCIAAASQFRHHLYVSIALSVLLLLLAGVFLIKFFGAPEQEWYRCRAVAESIKTSTWRFAMRANPFDDASSIDIPKGEFRNLLVAVLRLNKDIAKALPSSGTEQVTSSMVKVRSLSTEERKTFYVANRVDEQHLWYAKKAKNNKWALAVWTTAIVIIYFSAAVLAFDKQILSGVAFYIFDPAIVIITSLIGWLQIKRHAELSASYNLTCHEIGIVKSRASSVSNEEELSDFVNEAELAFSREHTQWVARRDAS